MWTESIPAFGLICGALAASGGGLKMVHSLFHDGTARRTRVDGWDNTMMKRDASITGRETLQNDDLDFKTPEGPIKSSIAMLFA
jgi:hypothetical protein